MTITPFSRRDLLVLGLILLIAAFMRFGRADVVEYFHDDGMLATLAQEMARGDAFHLTGINSSTGIPNPPTSVYALLPFFWISRDPVFAIYGIMALNVIGVGLLWAIAQRYFGRTAALVAGLAYAVNPWAVLYSRKLWAQDYHTPFFLLGLLLALYGFMEGDSPPTLRQPRFWAQIACLPILLFAMQIHFAAWALFPLYVMLLWMGRRRIARQTLAISVLLGGLMLLPYGIGLAQTLQSDPTRISDAMGRTKTREDRGYENNHAFTYTILLMTGNEIGATSAPHNEQKWKENDLVDVIVSLFIVPVMVFAILNMAQIRHPLGLWVLWWFFAPTLILSTNFTPVYPHYFIASIPAYMLVIGCVRIERHSFSNEKHKTKPRLLIMPYFVMAVIGIHLVLQFSYWFRLLDHLDNHHIPYPGFTTPLNRLLPIRDALAGETNVVVLSDGMAWDLNHEVSVWDTLLYDKACVRTLRGDGYFVQPAQPFDVLVAPNAPAGRVRDQYSGGTPEVFPERAGGGAYMLYRHEAAPQWETQVTPITPTRFANGVTLAGYDVGDVTTLQWRLPQGTRGENVQYTVQFYDAAGNRVEQADKVFWQSQHWCADDTLYTWVETPNRADAVTMRVGMYKLVGEGQYRPIAVLDASGQVAGDTAAIVLP